jgi:hypothetical protein
LSKGDGIGVHFETAIAEEAAEIGPARQGIADGLGQIASAGDELELLLEPSLEVVHQGARALLADALPNVGGTAAQVGFDGIKLGLVVTLVPKVPIWKAFHFKKIFRPYGTAEKLGVASEWSVIRPDRSKLSRPRRAGDRAFSETAHEG